MHVRGAVAEGVNMEGGSTSGDSGDRRQQQGRGVAARGGLKRGPPTDDDAKRGMVRTVKRVRAVVGLGC